MEHNKFNLVMDIIHKNGSWFYIYIYIYERFLTFITFLLLNKINLTIIKKKKNPQFCSVTKFGL